jgi:hypothetical protein
MKENPIYIKTRAAPITIPTAQYRKIGAAD